MAVAGWSGKGEVSGSGGRGQGESERKGRWFHWGWSGSVSLRESVSPSVRSDSSGLLAGRGEKGERDGRRVE